MLLDDEWGHNVLAANSSKGFIAYIKVYIIYNVHYKALMDYRQNVIMKNIPSL